MSARLKLVRVRKHFHAKLGGSPPHVMLVVRLCSLFRRSVYVFRKMNGVSKHTFETGGGGGGWLGCTREVSGTISATESIASGTPMMEVKAHI